MKQLLTSAVIWVLMAGAVALAQMPDLSQMSGVPLPTNDLPVGSVSVRVVRGDMSNNVVGQPVELHGAGAARTVSTDDVGRATFSGLTPGTMVHAIATVDGQRLESQEFPVAPAGGVRVMLVARGGAPEAAAGGAAAAPVASQAGTVALGSQSRFVVEIADETLEVYGLLELTNARSSPVQTDKPLVFAAPAEAGNMTVLEGSSPLAKAEGKMVTVGGPFPPGRTVVQFAYQIPYKTGDAVVRVLLPLPLPQTSLLVRKLPNVSVSSPQATDQRDTPIDGQTYVVATGPGIPAGGALEIALSGLPHHSVAPRYISLTFAIAIALLGAWWSFGGAADTTGQDRHTLEARREQLFAELVKLEEQHAHGRAPAKRYAQRRRDLVAHLTEIYTRLDELDPAAAAPSGNGREAVAVEASLRTRRA